MFAVTSKANNNSHSDEHNQSPAAYIAGLSHCHGLAGGPEAKRVMDQIVLFHEPCM